jgi:hypothetical protein
LGFFQYFSGKKLLLRGKVESIDVNEAATNNLQKQSTKPYGQSVTSMEKNTNFCIT